MWRIVFSSWLVVSLFPQGLHLSEDFPSFHLWRFAGCWCQHLTFPNQAFLLLTGKKTHKYHDPFLSKYTPFRPQAFFHLILKVLIDPRYSVLCWPSLWTVGNVENMRRREWELLFHINCAGHFQVLKSLQLPGMRSLSLLSVIFHCFCQTALGQQDELGLPGEEQGLAVQETGDYLASLKSSDKIGGSEQTWKKQKL